jgi:DNA-binding LacI/PurR family transcriptional regulator
MKKKAITLKDLAEALNVTVATVSRALRDSHEISPETKKRVVELAKSWNYKPNPLAVGLRKNRTFNVGVIIPSLWYYYNSAAVTGMEEVLEAHGYSVLICQSKESYKREVIQVKNLIDSRVDGIFASISQATVKHDHYLAAQAEGIPVIFFDRTPDCEGFSKVVIDNQLAAKKSIQHLFEKGRNRIAFIAGPEKLKISQKRYKGYEEAHQEQGIEVDGSLIINCNFTKNMGYQATKNFLRKRIPFDGLFAINDRTCIGAVAAIQEAGFVIPKDVAVIGFNDEPTVQYLNPPLTTIRQPAYEMGKEVAKLFLKERNPKQSPVPPTKLYLDTELIVRKST